jgi:hypothetical protein
MELNLAKLDDSALEELDLKLSLAASKMARGLERSKSSASTGETGQSARTLKEIAKEIMQESARGVRIAQHAESRPLVPLLQAAGASLSPEVKVDYEDMNYDLYWVQVGFSALLPESEFLNRASLHLKLFDDVTDPVRRVRPTRLFPDRKDLSLFKADLTGGIGLDANINIAAFAKDGVVLPFGTVTTDAKLKANIVVGPLEFQFRKAAVEVSGIGDSEVNWRYNLRSELSGANDFRSGLVLKVAREATSVNIDAQLTVVRCKRKWLVFRDLIPELPVNHNLEVELYPR